MNMKLTKIKYIHIFVYFKKTIYLCKTFQKRGLKSPNDNLVLKMKDRIKQMMESQNMTQQAFANFIDISTASLSGILTGRTKPTLNTVEAIRKSFPTINIEWLMFGTGEMFADGEAPDTAAANHEIADKEEKEATLDFGMDLDQADKASSIDTQDKPSSKCVVSTPNPNIIPAVKYIDKPQRHITEIRVYFDDLTFETFVPEK